MVIQESVKARAKHPQWTDVLDLGHRATTHRSAVVRISLTLNTADLGHPGARLSLAESKNDLLLCHKTNILGGTVFRDEVQSILEGNTG